MEFAICLFLYWIFLLFSLWFTVTSSVSLSSLFNDKTVLRSTFSSQFSLLFLFFLAFHFIFVFRFLYLNVHFRSATTGVGLSVFLLQLCFYCALFYWYVSLDARLLPCFASVAVNDHYHRARMCILTCGLWDSEFDTPRILLWDYCSSFHSFSCFLYMIFFWSFFQHPTLAECVRKSVTWSLFWMCLIEHLTSLFCHSHGMVLQRTIL